MDSFTSLIKRFTPTMFENAVRAIYFRGILDWIGRKETSGKGSASTGILETETATRLLSTPDAKPPCLTLETIPLDLLLLIIDHLDDVSRICLRGTNHNFRELTPVVLEYLSPCARWQAISLYEIDLGNNLTSITCALCRQRRHKRYFGAGEDWAALDSRHRAGSWAFRIIDQFPWLHRYGIQNVYCTSNEGSYKSRPTVRTCCLHIPDRFRSDPLVEELLQSVDLSEDPGWYVFPVRRCLHCGASNIHQQCTRCHCDVCPMTLSLQFYRQGLLGSRSPKIRQICKFREDKNNGLAGPLYVAEVGSECFKRSDDCEMLTRKNR